MLAYELCLPSYLYKKLKSRNQYKVDPKKLHPPNLKPKDGIKHQAFKKLPASIEKLDKISLVDDSGGGYIQGKHKIDIMVPLRKEDVTEAGVITQKFVSL